MALMDCSSVRHSQNAKTEPVAVADALIPGRRYADNITDLASQPWQVLVFIARSGDES
jgi:hypothetical protein